MKKLKENKKIMIFKASKNEVDFIKALRSVAKKFDRNAVFLNIMVADGLELVSACDEEGNMIFDGERNPKRDKPTYLG